MLPFMTTKNGTSLSTSQLDFAVSRLQASIQRFNDGEITSHKQMELSTLILFLFSFLQNLACCRIVLKEFTRDKQDLQQQIIGLCKQLGSIVPVEGSEAKEFEELTPLEVMQLRLVDYAQELADTIPEYLGKEAIEQLDDLCENIGNTGTEEGKKEVIELITGLTREEPLNKILGGKKEDVGKVMNVVNQVSTQMVTGILGAFEMACSKQISGRILPRNDLLEKYGHF